MTCSVVITGIGLLSPTGRTSRAMHEFLCSGSPTVNEDPHEVDNGAESGEENTLPVRASLLTDFDPRDYLPEGNLRPLDRPSQLAASAAALAISDAALESPEAVPRNMGIVAGTMFSGAATISEFDIRGRREGPARVSALDFANTVINAASGQTALWHRMTGLNSTIAAGGASSLNAIGYAAEMISNGREEVILAGGFESVSTEMLSAISQSDLYCRTENDSPYEIESNLRRPHISEGAAFLVLENKDVALKRGASVKARVAGFASRFCSRSSLNSRSPSPDDSRHYAKAIADTMSKAMANAEVGPREIDCISLSARGARMVDAAEAIAVETVFGDIGSSPLLSAIGMLAGDSLGAMGAFQTSCGVETLANGSVGAQIHLKQHYGLQKSTARSNSINAVLICSTSRDGHCSSLVLTSS